MKQLKTIVLSLPFVLAAVGCSQDELLPDGGKGTDVTQGLHEVDITFSVGANAGLQTRAAANPRPLEGPENWQRVTNMRIYVFKGKDKDEEGNPIENFDKSDDNQYFYYKPEIGGEKRDYLYVSDFYNTKVGADGTISNTWGDEDHEKENEEHTVTAKMKLDGGYYKFLAVGRDDIIEDNPTQSNIRMTDPNWLINQYPKNFIQNIKEIDVLSDDNGDYEDFTWSEEETSLSLAYILSGFNEKATELFSGCSAPVPVQESGGFSTTIELKRAVAGMLFYVKNIPAKLTAKATLKGEGSNQRPKEVIIKGKDYDVSRIGISLIKRNASVVLSTRSFLPANHEEYYFSNNTKTVNLDRGSYTTWLMENCISTDIKGESPENGYYTDTYMKGNFLMPQLAPIKIENYTLTVGEEKEETLTHTLYLVFYHKPDDKAEYFALDWRPIKIKSSKDSEGNSLPTEETYDFDILANRLYSLGSKESPTDLKPEGGGDNNLVITVNPDWDWKGELEWAN